MKYEKFQHKVTEEGLPQGPNFRRTNQSISTFGYSDFSPYRNEPYLDIFSPNGVIDMSNTGIPLLANGGYLAPYSGLHQFDTPWIREIPLMNEGGPTIDVDNFKNKVSELDTLFKQGTVDESDASVQDTLIQVLIVTGTTFIH